MPLGVDEVPRANPPPSEGCTSNPCTHPSPSISRAGLDPGAEGGRWLWGGAGSPGGAQGEPRGPCPRSIEGGELFERIIDDDYHLTEVDCMVFVRQICEGIRFMHHMHVLHLDLKVPARAQLLLAGAGEARAWRG